MESAGDWAPLALALSAAVTVLMQLAFFAVAFALKIDKVTDFAGCLNFIVLALLTLFYQPHGAAITARQAALTAAVCASRLQLGAFLLHRVLSRGRDSRFDEIRAKCGPFLVFWVFQMVWVFGCSVPLVYLNATPRPALPLGALDYAGWAIFGAGFALQVAADVQKAAFRADAANAKKVCTVGVWRYSRHPNFCGEVLMWWGVYVAGCAVFASSAGGYATVVSPLLTMFTLLCGTGIPTSEGRWAKRWYDGGEAQRSYEAYFESTPPLWPFVPALYRRMPIALKRLLCFECAAAAAARPRARAPSGRLHRHSATRARMLTARRARAAQAAHVPVPGPRPAGRLVRHRRARRGLVEAPRRAGDEGAEGAARVCRANVETRHRSK